MLDCWEAQDYQCYVGCNVTTLKESPADYLNMKVKFHNYENNNNKVFSPITVLPEIELDESKSEKQHQYHGSFHRVIQILRTKTYF